MMRIYDSIFKVAGAVTVICTLMLSSCGKEQVSEPQLEVSVKKTVVSSDKGQQFVSVICDGKWTLSLEYDSEEDGWASLKTTEGTGRKTNVVLSYDKNEGEHERVLHIILKSGTSETSCSMHQDPKSEHPLAKTGWMELPAMDNPDLGYYSHSFSMNGRSYRNYTFGWSQPDLVALWVAYPLCAMYIYGNAGRTDAWDADPLLKEDSSLPKGGYGGPYDRGHQVPSGDRQCCEEANKQTFYGTNMTPQSNPFNTGIWVDLENKVRSIAKASDTTYVVTGCMVKNPKGYTVDSNGKKMTIPSAYFKALLRYSKSSTLGQWNAAAFYLNHDEVSGSIAKSHSLSIDELEEITGIDFFVNLPKAVGETKAAQIESADPADSELWW